MTQEEKAKAYDEALKQARFYYGNCPSEPERKKLEEMFPVLCENEDERIIQFFAELATDACGGPGQEYYEELRLNYYKVMAWLEKQKEPKKEQKPSKWSKKDKKILQSLHHVMNCADAQNAVKRDGLSVEDVCNFLFSIEPNWKPSEEQVEELWNVISYIEKPDSNFLGVPVLLESLYKHLKELM